jgi:hypothetical protein
MAKNNPPTILHPAERAVLHTLVYFEVFSYPLTQAEILAFCEASEMGEKSLGEHLAELLRRGLVFQFGPFFQSKNDPAWVARRLACNRRADTFLPIARRVARLIGRFPFVRGVFVSGSLSKHCMTAESDIDFFIVTEPERLWLARTLLVIFKKIFLFNSHKYFCINYFVDTERLEIEEKNRFTATEAVTLLPMYGAEFYTAFCRANAWAWQQHPHFAPRSTEAVPPHSSGFWKKLLEKTFAGRVGDWLDRKAMRLTVGFWQRKFKHLDARTFDLALKSRRGISKHHPLHFQQKVLTRVEARMAEIAAGR